MKEIDLSIIIPFYNEEENVNPLFEKLSSVLETIPKNIEIIVIDDGSIDKTFEKLKQVKISGLKLVKFKKNFGQTSALAAGFEFSVGEIIITMDSDLQNDPKDIPKLLAKIKEGYDIVSGWRKKRKIAFWSRKLPSFFANIIIRKVTGVKLHDFGCTLKAYKKEVIKNINLYGELHRFIPILASVYGAKITEIEVQDHKRKYGYSKYNIFRIFKVILDIITVKFLLSYLTRPIHIFGILGFFAILVSIITGSSTILLKIFKHIDITGNPLFLLTILLIFIGVQFITLGLLGELIIRIYHEVQNKPIYNIEEVKEL